jgi:class 3 adenylate cyclase
MMQGNFEAHAASFRHIWYDSRASGLSERGAIDFSLAARTEDLRAVMLEVGGGPFVLTGAYDAVPVAISCAAAYPEDVSHLVLSDGWSSYSDYLETPVMAADEALRGQDWLIYTETLARVLIGFDDEAFAKQFGAYIRECVQPEALMAAWKANEDIDITALLPGVKSRTLIVHNVKNRFLTVGAGQRLAAQIPGAEFRLVDDMVRQQWPDIVSDFVLGEAAKPAEERVDAAFRAILFTDLVGHAEMMSRLGDEAGRAVLREHEDITRNVLKANGGTEVKTMGDGFMASFGSVTKAVECAIALQRAIEERNISLPAHPEEARSEAEGRLEGRAEHGTLSVRVGLNAGEPIEEDGDLFGATVILASRIAAKAEGGEILVSDNVRSLCSGKNFLFADRGVFAAKGIEEPVRIYEVNWRTPT